MSSCRKGKSLTGTHWYDVVKTLIGTVLTLLVFFNQIMRQLPGKAAKETRKMKRERKKGNSDGHQKILTVALPVVLGLFALLVAYVYTTASKQS